MSTMSQNLAQSYHKMQDQIQFLLHKIRTNLFLVNDPGKVTPSHLGTLRRVKNGLKAIESLLMANGGGLVSKMMECESCKHGPPSILDEDGVRATLSRKPGRWAHANIDGHWGCNNPPTAIPGPLPYLFATEMIAFGIGTECTEDECDGRLVLDGVCTWCGKEYPGHQGELKWPDGLEKLKELAPLLSSYTRHKEGCIIVSPSECNCGLNDVVGGLNKIVAGIDRPAPNTSDNQETIL